MIRQCLLATMMLAGFTGNASAQHPQHQVDDTCKRIANKLSSVSLRECNAAELQASDGYSVDNTPILIKEYPPIEPRQPLGRVLLLGGIHGDEYSSVTIAFKWIKTLDKHHSGLFHWKVAPLVNPDGLLRRRSQRMNANGVDLNRNFPTPNWQQESEHYWKVKTHRNPRRFPGHSPLSEPESKWLSSLIDDFKPDVIIAIHAPHGILDFDGPIQAPNRLGNLHLNLLGTYPGSLGNYAGVTRRIPVLTIELPYAGIMPPPSQISSIWTDMVKWLRHNMPNKTPVQAIDSRHDQPGQMIDQTGPS